MFAMCATVRFRVGGRREKVALEADLGLALLAAESLYGTARLRLEAGYVVGDDGATCVIESRGEAGDALIRIFAGLTAARLGDEQLTIEHIDTRSPGRERARAAVGSAA